MKINVAPRYLTSASLWTTLRDRDGDTWEAWAVPAFVPEGPYGQLDLRPYPTIPIDPSSVDYSTVWTCSAKEVAYVVATVAWADRMDQDYGPFSEEASPVSVTHHPTGS